MDDDVSGFTPGWYEEFIKPLEDKNVVMVGARLTNKDGQVVITSSGNNDLSKDYVDENIRHLPGTVIAYRRNDLGEIRWDEEYYGGSWNDTDFCEQLKAKFPEGKFVINNKVQIKHLNEMKEQSANFDNNQERFFEKWPKLHLTPVVMIGTPAYGGNFQLDYLLSTIGIVHSGIQWKPYYIKNESLIGRARNTILSAFYHDKAMNRLLFMDADIGLDQADFLKIANSRHDVTAAAVRLKSHDQQLNITKIVEAIDDQYVSVEHVGTAVFSLSRKAVNALVKNAIKNGDVYTKGTPGGDETKEYYDVFKTGVRDGVFLSEDFWCCQTLRELGFKVVVDNTILTRHTGNVEFKTIPAIPEK